jgi:hypothetical protein
MGTRPNGRFLRRGQADVNNNLFMPLLHTRELRSGSFVFVPMKILLWLLLLLLCWPVALLALVLYPIVWVLLLPFRIAGIAVEGALALLRALFFLPARVLGNRA